MNYLKSSGAAIARIIEMEKWNDFSSNFFKYYYVGTLRGKLWGMWKILTGKSVILIVRINPNKIFKEDKCQK